jgi:uridine kinase
MEIHTAVLAAHDIQATCRSLALAAGEIAKLPRGGRRLIAVDGVDRAGKGTFADALVPLVDRPVVRASADDFLDDMAGRLLAPFADGEPFCRRTLDIEAGTPVEPEREDAPEDAVLLVDGLTLHREQLRPWWDLSILLVERTRHVQAVELFRAVAAPARDASLMVPW